MNSFKQDIVSWVFRFSLKMLHATTAEKRQSQVQQLAIFKVRKAPELKIRHEQHKKKICLFFLEKHPKTLCSFYQEKNTDMQKKLMVANCVTKSPFSSNPAAYQPRDPTLRNSSVFALPIPVLDLDQ
jgi:hypothetical protein